MIVPVDHDCRSGGTVGGGLVVGLVALRSGAWRRSAAVEHCFSPLWHNSHDNGRSRQYEQQNNEYLAQTSHDAVYALIHCIALYAHRVGYLVGRVAFKAHLHQLSVFVLQLCHQVGDKSAPFCLGGCVVVGMLRQVVLHFTRLSAVAQHMSHLPFDPCFLLIGFGIHVQFGDMQPQPYGYFLKQVAAQLAVTTGSVAAHAPDEGGVGAQSGIEYLVVVHSDITIPLWMAKSDSM